MEKVKRFHLMRHVDESGMSGTGKVAEGVVLPNGMAVMWWLRPPHSVQQYRSIDDLHHIHKHGNRNTTSLVWEDHLGELDRIVRDFARGKDDVTTLYELSRIGRTLEEIDPNG